LVSKSKFSSSLILFLEQPPFDLQHESFLASTSYPSFFEHLPFLQQPSFSSLLTSIYSGSALSFEHLPFLQQESFFSGSYV
jgi:hypothetical protein